MHLQTKIHEIKLHGSQGRWLAGREGGLQTMDDLAHKSHAKYLVYLKHSKSQDQLAGDKLWMI